MDSSDCVYRVFMRLFLNFYKQLSMLLLEHALLGLACPIHPLLLYRTYSVKTVSGIGYFNLYSLKYVKNHTN